MFHDIFTFSVIALSIGMSIYRGEVMPWYITACFIFLDWKIQKIWDAQE